MNNKEDITKRFLDLYEILLKEKKINDKKDFSTKCNIPPKQLEFVINKLEGRYVNIEWLPGIIEAFPEVNINKILTGVGNFLESPSQNYPINEEKDIAADEEPTYETKDHLKAKIDELQAKYISLLERHLEQSQQLAAAQAELDQLKKQKKA